MRFRIATQTMAVLLLAGCHSVGQAPSQPTPLTDAVRNDAIRDVLDALDREYVDPDVAARIRTAVTAQRDSGHYTPFADAPAFAAAFTRDLQRVSHDKHLAVFVGRAGAHRTPFIPTADAAGCSLDTGFCKDMVFAGNIGHTQVRSFAGRVAKVRGPLADAMTRLASSDAIIIDVRRNVGGIPEVSQLLSSYFFDSTPVLLGSQSWRGDPRTEDFYTLRTVGGTRIGARKPVYVLISDYTFSAAEGFAYDRQARAIARSLLAQRRPAPPTPLVVALRHARQSHE
ncbi:MAG TPA: S41 family peptidase [Gemmatimonadaceae bacterium]